MIITNSEFESRMAFYILNIPGLGQFPKHEREALVLEAGETAEKYNENFWAICDNLIFMRRFGIGRKTPK